MSAAVTSENWNLSGLNTVDVFPLSSQAHWGQEWGATPDSVFHTFLQGLPQCEFPVSR